MRKNILLLIMCMPALLSAQNGVTVDNIVVKRGSPSTVTFDMSWNRNAMPVTPWSDTVWVFVDHNHSGTMTRLPLSGATLTASSAPSVGKVIKAPGNDNGVWVVGNAKTGASGSFSASVQLLIPISAIFDACAYASNYRPVAKYVTVDKLKLTGTPPFHLELNTGAVSAEGEYTLQANQSLLSVTDRTGEPGTIACLDLATPQITQVTPTPICRGTNVVFRVTAPEAGLSYIWTGNPAGTASGAANGTYTVSGANTGAKAVTVRSSITFRGITCQSANAATVTATVNGNPVPPGTTSNKSRCGAGTITLNATAVSGCTIDWYTAATGGTKVATGVTSFTTSNLTATTTYYAESRNTTTGCVSTSRAPITATVNALPGTPRSPYTSNCGPASLTLQVSVDNNCAADWYTVESGGTKIATGTSYNTPRLTNTTTYYVEARNFTTGCVSATRGQATATIYLIPTITASGNVYVTTHINMPLTSPLVFTAGNGATAIAGSGRIPPGTEATTTNHTVLSIDGTPVETGTFDYTITATGEGLCKSTTVGYVRVVSMTPPPGAASTHLWIVGTRAWSDNVFRNDGKCSWGRISDGSPSYLYVPEIERMYYNWECVDVSSLCTDGWSVPDLNAIQSIQAAVSQDWFGRNWGYGGWVDRSIINAKDTHGYLWTRTKVDYPYRNAYMMGWNNNSVFNELVSYKIGYQLRCVKAAP
jgi:hypothetical protein